PPIVAALTALVLTGVMSGGAHVDAVAFVSGVLGTLIGADLMNLNQLNTLGAPVASIGGAGTFDGVFLSGSSRCCSPKRTQRRTKTKTGDAGYRATPPVSFKFRGSQAGLNFTSVCSGVTSSK
ncbi:MAG TPA: DUF1614 domain-containing protein, partial [Candidatus Binataceae bacterium]|nr:DUF1614 domain-containing protein [Candidatus Binataceae bacterium]